jgi:hypothetical protein
MKEVSKMEMKTDNEKVVVVDEIMRIVEEEVGKNG